LGVRGVITPNRILHNTGSQSGLSETEVLVVFRGL